MPDTILTTWLLPLGVVVACVTAALLLRAAKPIHSEGESAVVIKPQRNSHTVRLNGNVSQRRGYYVLSLLAGIGIALVGVYHWDQLNIPHWHIPLIMISFVWMAINLIAAHSTRPYPVVRQSRLKVGVMVPIHNEGIEVLKQLFDGLDAQTRKPNRVYLVDDASTQEPDQLKTALATWQASTKLDVKVIHLEQNQGKRHAQAIAFKDYKADVWVTVDSDTVLDSRAIEEGISPFADKQVTAVAGLLVGLNNRATWWSRFVDLGFVSAFTNGRGAWSSVRSLAVACGGLAFYRGDVVRKYLTPYLTQTILGRPAQSGDDRFMTCYCALEGKTVYQESSVGYTLLPTNVKHLTKQRVRWHRTFFWGGVWALRRFSPKRLIWWLILVQFITFLLYSFIAPSVLLIDPIRLGHFPWMFVLYISCLSYVRTTRYMSVRRPDESWPSQFVTYLMSPLSSFLNLYLCTILQYVGLFTFWKTGWSTRKSVEVDMDNGMLPEAKPAD